jgi:hypothetical protein
MTPKLLSKHRYPGTGTVQHFSSIVKINIFLATADILNKQRADLALKWTIFKPGTKH